MTGGVKPKRLTSRVFGHRVSRRTANLIRFALLVPILLLALVAVLGQTGHLGRLALPAIGRAINAEVDADSVVIHPSGEIVLRNLTVRDSATPGRAGEILHVSTATARLDWSRAFAGPSAIRSLKLEDPTVRVSFERGTNGTNVSRLRLPDTASTAGAPSLPKIDIVRGSIELGEHFGELYDQLRRVKVDGALTPDPSTSGKAYRILLSEGWQPELPAQVNRAEPAAPASEIGTRLVGTIDESGTSVTLSGVILNEWDPEHIPSDYRELVEDLGLNGAITLATVTLPSESSPAAAAGPSAVAEFNGIELTVPYKDNAGDDSLRLRGVTGKATFSEQVLSLSAEGMAGDVPVSVDAAYRVPGGGIGIAEAPFEAKIDVVEYRFDGNAAFLPFLPDDVRKLLHKFASPDPADDGPALLPTARLNVSVTVARGWDEKPDGEGADGPGEIVFDGTIGLLDGSSAYAEFPYHFDELRGEIEFSNNEVEILGITGTASTGARLAVIGGFSPLGERAEGRLDLAITGVPIDATLEAAMPADRVGVLRRLFDDRLYSEMLERGLILTPAMAAELLAEQRRIGSGEPAADDRARLAEIERALRAPVFEYRGTAELDVTLYRPGGLDTEWDRKIDVQLPAAGMVITDFPLPIEVRNAHLRITTDRAEIVNGGFRPVNARGASLRGGAAIQNRFDPDIEFGVRGLRFDALTSFALAPPPAPGEPVDEGRAAADRILRGLDPNGQAAVQGRLLLRETGELGFRATVDLGGITFAPQPYPDTPPVLISAETGAAVVTDRGLRLDATGSAVTISGEASVDDPIEIRAGLSLDWSGPGDELRTAAHVEADGVFASAPIEQAIAAFSGGSGPASDPVHELRELFEPTGRADAVIDVDITPDRAVTVVDLTNLRAPEAGWLGGRVGIADPTGSVRVVADDRPRVELDDVSGTLVFDARPAGAVRSHGVLDLVPGRSPTPGELTIELDGGRFESLLSRAIAREIVTGVPAKEYLEHDARGVYDAVVTLASRRRPLPAAQQQRLGGLASLARISSMVVPRSIGFTRRGTDVVFDSVTGAVTADRYKAEIQRLSLSGPGLSLQIDGTAVFSGGVAMGESGRSSSTGLRIEGRADSLSPEVRAMLPKPVNDNIDAFTVAVDGPVSLTDASLAVRSGPGASAGEPELAFEFHGRVGFEGASAVIGAPIESAAGVADVEAIFHDPLYVPQVTMWAHGSSASVFGVGIEDARVRVEASGEEPGLVVVPHLSMRSAGGTLSGRAVARPAPGLGDQPASAFEFDLRAAGVGLQRLVDQVRPGETLPTESADGEATINGQVRLAGIVGERETLRGHGRLDAAGGDVIRTPGLLRFVEALNLQIPRGGAIKQADVEFDVDASVIRLRALSLQSRSLAIFGSGTLTIPDLILDARFLVRGMRRLPLIDRALNSLRDELFVTRLTGPVSDLSSTPEFVPELQRLARGIFGYSASRAAQQIDELRREHAQRVRRQREQGRYRQLLPRPVIEPSLAREPAGDSEGH